MSISADAEAARRRRGDTRVNRQQDAPPPGVATFCVVCGSRHPFRASCVATVARASALSGATPEELTPVDRSQRITIAEVRAKSVPGWGIGDPLLRCAEDAMETLLRIGAEVGITADDIAAIKSAPQKR